MTTEEIQKLISKSPTKHCHLDPIPTWLLKELTDPLIPSLTHIVNRSLESSVFPSAFKYEKVIPLFKKPNCDKTVLNNYCPGSNLSFISKLLETFVLLQVNEYMPQLNLFSIVQFAYCCKHSLKTALLKIHNDILIALDSQKGSSCFFSTCQ